MIEKIIELSIKNKFLVILMTLFVIVGGLYAMSRTPLDAIPDLSDVQVIIFTEYPGQAQSGSRLLIFWLFVCLHHL
jgi:Cu(I)/Ag(I) efflux system membrane protein CusA/SilA